MAINEVIMENLTKNLEALLSEVKERNERLCASLHDEIRLDEYDNFSNALQSALDGHERIIIPASNSPHIIERPIIIPSNRHIICEDGAVIRLLDGVKALALRNSNTADGTHAPITAPRNKNITPIAL